MANTETSIHQAIIIDASEQGHRLFRFNVGDFQLIDGRWITVGSPGMSDTIGFKSIVVTPEMVGQRLAVFTAIEVKKPKSRTQKKRLQLQRDFLSMVRLHGGIGGFATSVEEARYIMRIGV